MLDKIESLCYNGRVLPEWANRKVHIPGRYNKRLNNMKKLSLSRANVDTLRRVEISKEKVSRFIKNVINKRNAVNYTKKLSSLSLIFKVITFSLIMASVPVGTLQVTAKTDNQEASYDSGIAFDKNKQSPIMVPDNSKPVITEGESEFNKKEREVKEQELASRQVIIRDSTLDRTNANTVTNISYDPDLSTKRALAKKAAAAYGIDWRVLEAVWQVESGKEWETQVKSSAGAQGPMQFMSGTWNKYAVDADGDGVASINKATDAVYAGANLLAQAGASQGDYQNALFSYNHAQWYVDKVMAIANSISE